MSRRVFAVSIHFFVSLSIALVSGALVFFVWFPRPYGSLAGGLVLFMMLVGIDVVLGPCLTAMVAGPSKLAPELRRDIGVIVLLQLLAFGYGMYTITLARPVHLVFEVDRFRVVSAADVDVALLPQAPAGLRQLPWTGPTMIAARKSINQDEMIRALDAGLQGVDIAMQPDRWVDYSTAVPEVLQKARTVKSLLKQYPKVSDQVLAIAAAQGVAVDGMLFLPLQSRQDSAVVLVAPSDARILGYLQVDGFF